LIQLVLTLCLLTTFSFAALAQDVVATLYSSTGVVEVTLSKSMRTTQQASVQRKVVTKHLLQLSVQ